MRTVRGMGARNIPGPAKAPPDRRSSTHRNNCGPGEGCVIGGRCDAGPRSRASGGGDAPGWRSSSAAVSHPDSSLAAGHTPSGTRLLLLTERLKWLVGRQAGRWLLHAREGARHAHLPPVPASATGYRGMAGISTTTACFPACPDANIRQQGGRAEQQMGGLAVVAAALAAAAAGDARAVCQGEATDACCA